MRPDELTITYFIRIIEAIEMVTSRDVDVNSEWHSTQETRVLRTKKALHAARIAAHFESGPNERSWHNAEDYVRVKSERPRNYAEIWRIYERDLRSGTQN